MHETIATIQDSSLCCEEYYVRSLYITQPWHNLIHTWNLAFAASPIAGDQAPGNDRLPRTMAALLAGKSACITGGVTGQLLLFSWNQSKINSISQELDVPSRLATSTTALQ